jgi:hypothetical protein
MKKFLISKLVSLLLIGSAAGMSVEQLAKVEKMATAIARTEGFYKKGTIPNRLHNPGDIMSSLTHAYPGQVGLFHHYVVFKSDRAGWTVLENQIISIINAESTRYTQAMTFAQIAKVYAASPNWVKTFCTILQISPSLTFQEYFELAPLLTKVKRHDTFTLVLASERAPMPRLYEVQPVLAQVR